MPTVVLYHTLGCHLCELAEDVLNDERSGLSNATVEKVDISESDRLIECYGVRIPVLFDPIRQTTLDWPFDAEQVRQWLTD